MGTNDGNIYVSNDLKDFRSSFDHHAKKVIIIIIIAIIIIIIIIINNTKTDRAKFGKGAGAGVTAIAGDKDKNILVTGAKDGSITIWDTSNLTADNDEPTISRQLILSDGKSAEDSANIENVLVPDITAKGIQSISIAPRILIVAQNQPLQVLLLLLLPLLLLMILIILMILMILILLLLR
jgi:WD40 repeat protein